MRLWPLDINPVFPGLGDSHFIIIIIIIITVIINHFVISVTNVFITTYPSSTFIIFVIYSLIFVLLSLI